MTKSHSAQLKFYANKIDNHSHLGLNDTMYVCLCNAVTEAEVVEACDGGASSLPELQEQLGVAMGCGQCADTCCAMLEGKDALAAVPGNAASDITSGINTRA